MNSRLPESGYDGRKESANESGQRRRKSSQQNHVETMVLDVQLEEGFVIRHGMQARFNKIVLDVLANQADAYTLESSGSASSDGAEQISSLYKYQPLTAVANGEGGMRNERLPSLATSELAHLQEEAGRQSIKDKQHGNKGPKQKAAKGSSKAPQIQEMYDRLIHLQPNCSDDDVKSIAVKKKVFLDQQDLDLQYYRELEDMQTGADPAFRAGSAAGLGAGILMVAGADPSQLTGGKVIKSFKTIVRLAYQLNDRAGREWERSPAGGSARIRREDTAENQRRNLIHNMISKQIINDIQEVKQTMKAALAQSLLTFFKECLWDAFFDMASTGSQPPRDGQPGKSRVRADSGSVTSLSPKLSNGQIKKMLELSQVIEISDIDDRKYGKFLRKGNFDSHAFAHLVARFRQSHNFVEDEARTHTKQGNGGGAGSSGTLCFIMQEEQEESEIAPSGLRNARRTTEEGGPPSRGVHFEALP